MRFWHDIPSYGRCIIIVQQFWLWLLNTWADVSKVITKKATMSKHGRSWDSCPFSGLKNHCYSPDLIVFLTSWKNVTLNFSKEQPGFFSPLLSCLSLSIDMTIGAELCDQILFSTHSLDKAVLRQHQNMLSPSVVSKVGILCLGFLKIDWLVLHRHLFYTFYTSQYKWLLGLLAPYTWTVAMPVSLLLINQKTEAETYTKGHSAPPKFPPDSNHYLKEKVSAQTKQNPQNFMRGETVLKNNVCRNTVVCRCLFHIYKLHSVDHSPQKYW